MAKSMTGFGRGVYTDELRSVTVELRSVNHRYSDITVKMPRRYQFAEDTIKNIVKGVAPRGKIDVFVNVDNIAADDTAVELNIPLAKRYFETLQTIKAELPQLSGEPTLAMVANFPDVVKSAAAEEDEELVLKALTEATKEAAANLDAMRIVEGAKLMEDILQRGQLIEQTVCGIEVYAPEVAKNYAAKMKERIQELLGDEATIPEDRIVLEAAVFADKSNITEEMVRLKSHCSQLKSIAADTSGPIGKKLDFLVQEMNRESNTIGSKANDIRITNDVLLLKAEIEKIREQVQNIE
ncbi:MAG: YicC family protein [Firmicutes bacterium]|nr:YicC family protein [Bacillota bacterium]MBQ1579795.1 YicC family protein [Bacillota bacterium]MBQ2084309.1 YicC family protein [Bacillota bacterium]MBQ4005061.1 YicC family protein [Bacillota bacterium]